MGLGQDVGCGRVVDEDRVLYGAPPPVASTTVAAKREQTAVEKKKANKKTSRISHSLRELLLTLALAK